MDGKLVEFIQDARKKGYEDWQIRDILTRHRWPKEAVESAFTSIHKFYENKKVITISLSPEILKKLEKRAKKNLLSLHEQIEDILRRSCLNIGASSEEKLDDRFIGFFSRRK